MTLEDGYLSFSYELAGRTVDPLAGVVEYKGRKRSARRKQLEVLALLASAEGKVVARRTFIEVVWENNALVGDTGLTDTVSDLRQTLDDSDRDHPLIRTIPRRGYQLSATARRLETAKPVAFEAGAEIPGAVGWRLQRLLYSNAVSEAWFATGPDSALRVFRFCRDEQHLRLLRREATLLRYLQQALGERTDIAHITTWQLDEPPYFLELEHFPLGALSSYAETIGGIGNIASAERLRWMAAIAAALAAVHEAGVVHRNVSADSIFLAKDDGQLQPRLGEFGFGELPDRSRLGAITAAGLTLPGHLAVGPSVYLAPERVRGEEATAASDVYALGVLLLQIASGDLARPAAGWQLAIDDARLRDLIAACLEPEPAQRPTAAVLVERLRDATTSQVPAALALPAVPAREAEASSAPPPPSARNTDRIEARPGTQFEVKAGQTIGPYRVIEKLGQGGMGVVYLAEQREPVQRQVALKVILAGMDTMEVLARFEAERQALALMNHPNVAAVFDAGSSATGRPYFAMEYVPGLDITAHCDQRELDFRQRIELFQQVCDGVLHAHQKGIIHRDLKPSNILIKSAQGQPATAKIIDFGVAKSLQRKLGRFTAHTQHGSFVGTPSYSSPEQISGHSAQIDTRTDIYSLGVVLYELLAGVTPYSEEALAGQSPLEISKLLRSQLPPLLKRFISLEANTESEIAGRRKMTVAQLKATLGSDLSWIVAKCLEHDPAERYASLLELQKDLQRWLGNRPVEARPITFVYRARKMVKRNRTAVVISVAVAFALLTTSAIALLAARDASFHRRLAEEQRQLAERERDVAKQVVDLMSGIFTSADPYQSNRDRPMTVEAAVDRGLESIQNATDLEPAVRYELLLNLATVYGALGQYAKSLEIGRRILARDHKPEVTIDIRTLLIMANASAGSGQAKPALEYAQRAHALASSTPSLERKWIAQTTMEVGMAYNGVRDYVAASTQLGNALALYREIYSEESLEVARVMLEYGSALRDVSKYAEAESLMRRSLEINSRLRRQDDMELTFNQIYLGQVLLDIGKNDEAIELYVRADEVARTRLGQDHPQYVTMLSNLAYAFEATDQVEKALDLREKILTKNERLNGKQSTSYVTSLINLGGALSKSNRTDEAQAYFTEALEITNEFFQDQPYYVAVASQRLAETYYKKGLFRKAESTALVALESFRRIYSEPNAHTAASLVLNAQIALETGSFEGAATYAGQAAMIYQNILPEKHWRITHTQALASLAKLKMNPVPADVQFLERTLRAAINQQSLDQGATAELKKMLAILRDLKIPHNNVK